MRRNIRKICVLNTPKKSILKSGRPRKYLLNSPNQKSPGMENFEPQKIIRSSPSLRPVRTRTKTTVWHTKNCHGKFCNHQFFVFATLFASETCEFFRITRRNFSWSCSRNKMTRRRIAGKGQRILSPDKRL